jgi:hypothetical protein
MKILYKFPSRSRPHKFFAALDNIHSLAQHDDFEILASLDIDDSTMASFGIMEKLKDYPKVRYYWGHSKSKIEAINRDMDVAGEFDILLVHSDDMEFIVPGFDLEIIKAFENFEGLVHFPDQVAKAKLITYPMMHRKYFERDGWIYHPDFKSVYADNFQQDLAKRRGMYKFVNLPILMHKHSMWGYGVHDALTLRNENGENYHKDKLVWQRLLNDPRYA